jgi:hypothetical protein
MKYIRFTKRSWLILGVVAAMISISVSSCKKGDNTYYNYVNDKSTYNGNALEYLRSQPGVYDSMLLVVNRLTGLVDSVSKGNLTIFAMSNRSFALALQNINQARKDSFPSMQPVSLSTIDSSTLDTFFCRYLIKGKQLSNDLISFTDGRTFPTVRYDYNMQLQYTKTNASGFVDGGPKALIFSDPKNSIFTRYWIRVNTTVLDIKTSNAIVDVLPPGHDFGFGDDFIRAVNRR